MPLSDSERRVLIDRIRCLPDDLEACVNGLTNAQLTTHYIDGEWTVAQNIHHVADSHMNSYIRFKLLITEDQPTLKPYDQNIWAELSDATTADVSTSLALIRSLHARWVDFLENLPGDTWGRTGYHPENGEVSIEGMLEYYADHGHGHIDQIKKTLAAQKLG